jgi:hypothetical protein
LVNKYRLDHDVVIYFWQLTCGPANLNLVLVSCYTWLDYHNCNIFKAVLPYGSPSGLASYMVVRVQSIHSVVAVIPRPWIGDFFVMEKLGLGFKAQDTEQQGEEGHDV